MNVCVRTCMFVSARVCVCSDKFQTGWCSVTKKKKKREENQEEALSLTAARTLIA